VLPEDATPPVALEKAMPAYPEEARKQSVEAIIGVSFVVEEDGTTSDVRVVKAYSHPLFDDAVIAAAKTWKFKPATLEGKPIRVRRLVRVPFRLRTQ
jgi:protein TonB